MIGRLLGVVALVLGLVSQSYATLDLTSLSIDTAPVFQMALLVLTAIAAIWAIKKVIKLGNKS